VGPFQRERRELRHQRRDGAHLSGAARVWFAEEKLPYRVRARDQRFLVCTKPHNPMRTVLYSIIDLKEQVRGPENLVFGMGAETDKCCLQMLDRLNGRHDKFSAAEKAEVKAVTGHEVVDDTWASEVSHRHRIALNIVKVEHSGKWAK
jgi:hypothetical protein